MSKSCGHEEYVLAIPSQVEKFIPDHQWFKKNMYINISMLQQTLGKSKYMKLVKLWQVHEHVHWKISLIEYCSIVRDLVSLVEFA